MLREVFSSVFAKKEKSMCLHILLVNSQGPNTKSEEVTLLKCLMVTSNLKDACQMTFEIGCGFRCNMSFPI